MANSTGTCEECGDTLHARDGTACNLCRTRAADAPVVVGCDLSDVTSPVGWTVEVAGSRFTLPADAVKVDEKTGAAYLEPSAASHRIPCCKIGCGKPAAFEISGPGQYDTTYACADHREDLEADGSFINPMPRPVDLGKVLDFARRYAYRYDARAEAPAANPEVMKIDPAIAEAAKQMWEEARPEAPRAERHLAVLWMNESTVLDVCVREGLNKPQVVVRGEWPGLPADVKVHEVRHEWSRKQFGFVLSSASFPPVPEGVPLPDVPERLLMRYNYVEVGTRPAAYYPDAVKREMPSAFRGKPVGWAVSSGDRHLATFALEELADEYLNFIRGPGR